MNSVMIYDSEFSRSVTNNVDGGFNSVMERHGVPIDGGKLKIKCKEVWRMDKNGLCFYQHKNKVYWDNNNSKED